MTYSNFDAEASKHSLNYMDLSDIIANQNHIKTRQNMSISDGMHCTYSAFCAAFFLTNTVSFPWNRGTIHGSMYNEFWDRTIYLHNIHDITNWRAHESTKNWYSNYNKAKLNKTICVFYWMYCVCANGSIRSQWSFLLTWSPFGAIPLTKAFMI